MITNGTSILEFLPQRPPVVMIDKLISADDNKTISGLLVKKSNIFFERDALSESGLVENIAQTAAAGVGYICKQENRKVPVGFIASIKDLVIHQLPAEGDELVTEVTVGNQVMAVSIIHGSVYCNGNLLASCEMRIFVKQEDPVKNF